MLLGFITGVSLHCLLTHELAHVGGWPGNHPGAVQSPMVCGGLLMPGRPYPVGSHKYKIHYVDPQVIVDLCHGPALACTLPHPNGVSQVYLPNNRQ